MKPEEFAYWMQGFVELQNSDEPPTKEQWQIIKDHLQLVFNKVTPKYSPDKKCDHTYCDSRPDYWTFSSIVEDMKKGEVDFNLIPKSC
jgi:hypothetical protein